MSTPPPKKISWEIDAPVCRPWVALATINLSTKFEVSISVYYEDMKGDTKYRKWDSLG